MYEDFQKQAQAFSYIFCRYAASLSVSFSGRTERVQANWSPQLFPGPRRQAALGRLFTPEQDDRVYKGHPAAVLSHHTGSAASPRTPRHRQKLIVDDYPMIIVGVSARDSPAWTRRARPGPGAHSDEALMTPGWDDIGDRPASGFRSSPHEIGLHSSLRHCSLQPLFISILRQELTERR